MRYLSRKKKKKKKLNTDLYIFVSVGYELVSDNKHVWALFSFTKPVQMQLSLLTVDYNDLNIFMLLIL